MAEPRHPTVCYPSTHYVESAGAIQFIPATTSHPEHQVIIVWYPGRNGYLLAKGRRNIQEARAHAAVRETAEETGIASRLLPIRLHCRNPPEFEEDGYTPDEVRTFDNVIEPFMIVTRDISKHGVKQLKLMFWYIAVVEDEQPKGLKPELGLKPSAVSFEDAVKLLIYQCDREVMRAAIKVFEENWELMKSKTPASSISSNKG